MKARLSVFSGGNNVARNKNWLGTCSAIALWGRFSLIDVNAFDAERVAR